MTIQQRAYQLIDVLTEDNVQLMIVLMEKLSKGQVKGSHSMALDEETERARKIRAYERLQELREIAKTYDLADLETEREAAMREKYNDF